MRRELVEGISFMRNFASSGVRRLYDATPRRYRQNLLYSG